MSKLHDYLKAGEITEFIDLLTKSSPKEVNEANQEGKTLLQILFTNSFDQETISLLLKMLINKGIDVNKIDGDGDTPLCKAIFFKGRIDIIQLLLDAKADITKPSVIKDKSAAVDRGRTPTNKKDISPQIRYKYPLHMAIEQERGDIIAALMKQAQEMGTLENLRLQLHIADEIFDTPLHRAIRAQSQYCRITIPMILAHGPNINASNEKGNTPLHTAVEALDVETVGLLVIMNGIKLDAVNIHNQTALHLAFKLREFGYPLKNTKLTKIAKILVEAGASLYPHMMIEKLIRGGKSFKSERERNAILYDTSGRTPEDYFNEFSRIHRENAQTKGEHYNPGEFEALRCIIQERIYAETQAKEAKPTTVFSAQPAAVQTTNPPLPKLALAPVAPIKPVSAKFWDDPAPSHVMLSTLGRVPELAMGTGFSSPTKPAAAKQPLLLSDVDKEMQEAIAASLKIAPQQPAAAKPASTSKSPKHSQMTEDEQIAAAIAASDADLAKALEESVKEYLHKPTRP